MMYFVYMGDKKTRQVTFRITESLYKEIEKEADRHTRSISEQLLHFLRLIYGELKPEETLENNYFKEIEKQGEAPGE